MRFPKANRLLILLLFLGCLSVTAQFTIPKKPSKQTSVYDYIDLLPAGQEKALEQKLIRYADSTSTQIVVAIIGTTQGEDVNYLGAQWAHSWGIGQEGKDNGIFILLAKDDRKIGINTGYGIESTLTDALSKRIIETVIIPEFKTENYYAGLDRGADAIFQVLTGQYTEDRTFDNGAPLRKLFPILIFIIIMIILWSKKNKGGGGGNGGRRSGLDIWDMIILSNMGRSSGSSGSFGGGSWGGGGGGFGGGFGGGGFGGGGASGGW